MSMTSINNGKINDKQRQDEEAQLFSALSFVIYHIDKQQQQDEEAQSRVHLPRIRHLTQMLGMKQKKLVSWSEERTNAINYEENIKIKALLGTSMNGRNTMMKKST